MKRNWDYIQSIPCRATQIALAVCSITEVVTRLKIAFPEVFEEGKEEIIGFWSTIRTKWEEYCAREYGPPEVKCLLHTLWGEAVHIPFELNFGKWVQSGRDEMHKDGPIPQTVVDQIEKLTHGVIRNHEGLIKEPITIRYLDQDWIVSRIWTEYEGAWGLPNSSPEIFSECELSLVPKKSIIFD